VKHWGLHKIIALFSFIFLAGILMSVITIRTTLNKQVTPIETVALQKDIKYLLKLEAEKKRFNFF
jgi:hypothetical protein